MTGYPPQPPVPSNPAGNPLGYGPRGPADDQLWALLSYVLTFVAHIIAPLIIYLVKMNESGYVRYHAAQSLNLNITGFVYAIGSLLVGLILGVVTHGIGFLVLIPLLIAIGIGELVFLILAAIAANRGELYHIPTFACLPIVH
jgi:uncharacterized Tic20 family protein